MSFDYQEREYEAPHGGTHTPGADPLGYSLAEDEGSKSWFEGALVTFKAKAADTKGMMSFIQCDVPYGWQAPVHRHANESEFFFITEGEWEVLSNETVHLVRPGGVVWIPPNTNHSIFVRSIRGRGYCVTTPGGFERFFELAGEPATVPSMPTHKTHIPTNEELAKIGQDMGWELIEPEPRRYQG